MKISWNGKLCVEESCRVHKETDHVLKTILSPYFKTASFNCYGMNLPFAFNSYCHHEDQPNEYGKTVVMPSVIPFTLYTKEKTFWARCHPTLHEREESPNIRLKVGELFVGLLCPETQTLWATGWTHLEEYRPMTQLIINFLAEEGLLRVLPPMPKKKKRKSEKQTFTITIGGDPEFELVDNHGEVLRAASTESFDIRNKFGNVGVDGSGYQVELRPSPGSPKTVVENVRKLLEEFNTVHGENFKLAASSSKFPCGGHIHVGIDPPPDTGYYGKLSKVLDEFIGRNTLELNGPARESGNEHGYGKVGDFRKKSYGMEYRTPPSSVWKNPELTEIVLKLTYNLAVNLANNLSLEFPTPVEKETLKVVGGLSEEEAAIFMEECGKPAPKNTECLLAAWEIERKIPSPKITVTFRDSWYGGVKSIILRELAKIEVTSNIGITLYGLRESRGEVYTIPMEGCEVIPHPGKGYGPTTFGFPKLFRTGGSSSIKIVEAAKVIGKIVVDFQNGVVMESPVVEEPERLQETEVVGDVHSVYISNSDGILMDEEVDEEVFEGGYCRPRNVWGREPHGINNREVSREGVPAPSPNPHNEENFWELLSERIRFREVNFQEMFMDRWETPSQEE